MLYLHFKFIQIHFSTILLLWPQSIEQWHTHTLQSFIAFCWHFKHRHLEFMAQNYAEIYVIACTAFMNNKEYFYSLSIPMFSILWCKFTVSLTLKRKRIFMGRLVIGWMEFCENFVEDLVRHNSILFSKYKVAIFFAKHIHVIPRNILFLRHSNLTIYIIRW